MRGTDISIKPGHFIPVLSCSVCLCSVSTGANPVTDPTTLGSVAKVVESGEKRGKMVGRL